MKHVDEVLSYEIDDLTASFKFSDRLAQENMWNLDYAKRVIEEYKKFMYLCSQYSGMTPSVDVDEVWHLHMIYSRDYEEFCQLLGKKIYHGPTRGGKKEDDRYWGQYENTLLAYKYHFGEYPEDIWPPAKERFLPLSRVRIDMRNHWVIPVGDYKALFKILFNRLKQFL